MEFELLLKSHSEEKARELLQSRYSLSGTQKPFLVLHESASTPPNITKRKTRKSTGNKLLKQFLQNGDPNYTKYKQLNDLWTQYMENSLKSTSTALQTVLCADWHGSFIEILNAKSPSMIGLKGILLWEGKNLLVLVTNQNNFKQVPKSGTVFSIHYKTEQFMVVGDRVNCRNSERTSKKFKPHNVSDITSLLAPFFFSS